MRTTSEVHTLKGSQPLTWSANPQASTWSVEMEAYLNAAELVQLESLDVERGDVEGLPLSLVEGYVDLAIQHATVRQIESGLFFATVSGLEGAWGDGETPEEALEELREAIIGWVAVKRRVKAGDIPTIEGLDLNVDF